MNVILDPHECHFDPQCRNYYQVRPVSIAAELNRKNLKYWFQINKNLPLFDRAMICSNNSMLWRTASLFTAVIQVTTRVTCDAWRVHTNNDNMETVLGAAKFKDFQNMKFPELSQDAFTK